MAEELCVAPGSVRLLMGDTDHVPFDMGTFGSRTTPTMNPQLRRAASAAREALDRPCCGSLEGRTPPSCGGQRRGYGPGIAAHSQLRGIGQRARTRPGHSCRGTLIPRRAVEGDGQAARQDDRPRHRDAAASLSLRHQAARECFTARCCGRPRSAPRSVTLDTPEAEQMPGVTVVHDGNFVGVAAPNPRVAAEARSRRSMPPGSPRRRNPPATNSLNT